MKPFPFDQAWHVFIGSIKLKLDGIKEYDGDAEHICTQIVEDCWNGRFFQTSTTHFPQFWTRDFGWCVESLLALGYTKEVEKTLRYVLQIFARHGRITTTISLRTIPFDFPCYSVDSLPWLTYALVLLGDKDIIDEYHDFLEKQARVFLDIFIDKKSGMVKNGHFSSIKDFSIRQGSCYDNTMAALLSKNFERLGLPDILRGYDYDAIVRKFWNGSYFYDDMQKLDYVAADANIFPFSMGIVKDREMVMSALEQLHREGLDHPFPIKYTRASAPVRFIWSEYLLRGYERDALWGHMGPMYIAVMKSVDGAKARELTQSYKKVIETHKNYLEVFAADGRPFRTLLYHTDQGMLWAANYLTL